MRCTGPLVLLLVLSVWTGCKKPPAGPDRDGPDGEASTSDRVELGDRWVPVIIKGVGDTLWIAARDTNYFAYQSRIFAWVDGQIVDTMEVPFTIGPAIPSSGGDIEVGEAILVSGEDSQHKGVWKYTRGSGWQLVVGGVDMCRIDDPLQVACDRANPLDGSYTLVYTLDGGETWDSLFLGQYEWRLGMAFDAFPVGDGKFLVMVGIPTYVLMVDGPRSQIDTLWYSSDSTWVVDAGVTPDGEIFLIVGPVPTFDVTPVWFVVTTADTFRSVDTLADLTGTAWGRIPEIVLYPHQGNVYGVGKIMSSDTLAVFVFDLSARTWRLEAWPVPEGLPSQGIVKGAEVMADGRWALLLSNPLEGSARVIFLRP